MVSLAIFVCLSFGNIRQEKNYDMEQADGTGYRGAQG